ncbi:MAG: hypothetical protein V1837_01145 [Candidatus Woesearchaeota archaeon]
MSVQKTAQAIASLKIQGAENIAKSALDAIGKFASSSRADSKLAFMHELAKSVALLERSRPTEPTLRNVLKFVVSNSRGDSLSDFKTSLCANVDKVMLQLDEAEKVLSKIGAMKIKSGMVVFTHCHSSTVTSVLKAAKDEAKSFVVHNTETRPNLQGRITATELAGHGIKVVHFIDSAARLALKNADLMLIGCDAFTSEGKIVNKVGSELFAEVAYKRDIPVYVCSTTFKFDARTVIGFEEKIEARSVKEIWQNPPKNVTIDNHVFEMIDPNLVTGMITEVGVYKPEVLVEELKARKPWMFR